MINVSRSCLVISIILLITGCAGAQKNSAIWSDAGRQIDLMYKNAEAGGKDERWFPRTLRNDSLRQVVSDDWTSGFFPGILWMLYEHTRDAAWKQKAEQYTARMYREPTNGRSHDVGFKVYNSFGQAYRLTGEQHYRDAVLQGAATLVTRFNPTVGCIRSWDFRRWQFPVIIDNMMNLELLFAATRLSGDSTFYRVAVSHASTTLRNHFRNDFSSWHVLDYDSLTGQVVARNTHQGYADSSSWARGQAWALYGFTMCYRETRDLAYLEQAEGIAQFLINHPRLPEDKVPYWDFDAPVTTQTQRDVSAAAIMASALWELAGYSSKHQKAYKKFAGDLAQTLARYYRSSPGGSQGFILLHSTGHLPANSEIDVPLIYADYYFLELLKRMKE